MIVFEVPGECLAKPRPRALASMIRLNGKLKAVAQVVYPQDDDSRKWSQDIAECAVAAFAGIVDPANPYLGPVEIVIVYVIERPKSLPKWKSIRTPMLNVPDLDNFDKLVLDSLTGVVWRDDRQVWKKQSEKLYAATGESPKCVIGIQFTEELKRAPSSPPAN